MFTNITPKTESKLAAPPLPVVGTAVSRGALYRATVSYSCSLESAVVRLEKATGRPDWLMVLGLTEANYLEKTGHLWLGMFESGRTVPEPARELVRKLVALYFERPPIEFVREHLGADWQKAEEQVAA